MIDRAQIMAWRRERREQLIAARMALSVEERQRISAQLVGQLERSLRSDATAAAGMVVSGYWPLRGEPDVRPWLGALHDSGYVCALPVVVEKGAPLQFRRWSPGCAMEKGFWNIPVPADARTLTPQLLLAPLVGFDRQGYRLGYGGGYFDRTLARLQAQHSTYRVIGVGYAAAELQSIQPLSHDIPLQEILTESERITPTVSQPYALPTS